MKSDKKIFLLNYYHLHRKWMKIFLIQIINSYIKNGRKFF